MLQVKLFHASVLGSRTKIAPSASGPALPWPIFHTAGYGRQEVAQLLISAGAKMDAINATKQTPLDVAKLNREVSRWKGVGIMRGSSPLRGFTAVSECQPQLT